MAKIFGTSGAWKSVVNLLPIDVRKNIVSIENLYSYHDGFREKLNKVAAQSYDEYKLTVEKHNLKIQAEYKKTKASIALSKQVALQRTRKIKAELQKLRTQRNFILRFLNRAKISLLEKELQFIRSKYQKDAEKQKKLFFAKYKKLKGSANMSYDDFVRQKQRRIASELNYLQSVVMQPQQLAGAAAELAVIDELRKLSDSYYVFNDITLGATRAYKFDYSWLKRAQIDHLVVAPTGIFIIETKHWSESFVRNGNFFDPYQQIKRAQYLAYKLIGEPHGVKVRAIIAYRGHLPSQTKPKLYIKVLPIDQLIGYIRWFEKQKVFMTDVQLQKVLSTVRHNFSDI